MAPTFTIFEIDTNPFYDLQMRVSIAGGGSHQPKSFKLTPELLVNPKSDDMASELQEKNSKIEKIAYENINQILFGNLQGNMIFNISEYDMEITNYPVGDVVITGGWSFLKADCYKKDLAQIVSKLKKELHDAHIVIENDNITIQFH